ncbi:hypothetical protein F5890DRAFT_602902 [Lentinula detonsa]|uniref:CCHC-type domain-containing protein n=1 Tax=Lentinula detonsa TaxID=2804962 RepID=A0AA38PTG5_9AGAR|nr:hypothetical protein F5890DRAFT_602902 [Lentinula detonsa]
MLQGIINYFPCTIVSLMITKPKCQQPGHWASNCPKDGSSNKRSRSFGSNGGNISQQDQACFKCGKSGHYGNACTASSNSVGNSSKGSSSSRVGKGRGSGGGRGSRGGRGRGRGRSKTKSGLSIPGEIF